MCSFFIIFFWGGGHFCYVNVQYWLRQLQCEMLWGLACNHVNHAQLRVPLALAVLGFFVFLIILAEAWGLRRRFHFGNKARHAPSCGTFSPRHWFWNFAFIFVVLLEASTLILRSSFINNLHFFLLKFPLYFYANGESIVQLFMGWPFYMEIFEQETEI